MKTKFILSILTASALLFCTCKKVKSDPEPEPVPSDTYNPPPAGGDLYMGHVAYKGFCWTKNFTDFTVFSSKYTEVFIFGFVGDTLLIFNNNKVSFGNIYNPADFKSVNCSKSIISLSWIKGTIVCTAQDGNNYYVGSCAYKSGQTDMQFTLLSSGVQIYKLFNVGYAVVSAAYVNNVFVLASTKNGMSWSFKSTPSNFPTSSYSTNYKNYNNTIYAYDNYSCFTTVDTSFQSSSWTPKLLNLSQNTSDSAGYFESALLRKQGNSWVSYGSIHTNHQNDVPAKNVSTNDGQTFTTTLLTGIPTVLTGYSHPYGLTKTHVYASCYDKNTSTYKYYVSSDFKNFTTIVPEEWFFEGLNDSRYVE